MKALQRRTPFVVAQTRGSAGPSLSLLAGICFCAVILMQASLAVAQSPPPHREDPLKASTSRAAQEDAVQSIPLERIDPASREKISGVLNNVSIFRRLPVRMIQCDPDLYLFLLQHPDVVVNIWQLLGASKMSMVQTGPTSYRVTDEAGTAGTLEYLYQSPDTQVVFSDGKYEGPLFGKTIHARAVIVVKSGYVKEADGRCYITTRLDAFMNVQNLGVEILTKTFQPLVGRAADINFAQTATFVSILSHTAELNQTGIQRLASRLSKVQPEVRQQFAQTTDRVAQRAAAWNRGAEAPPLVIGQRPQPETDSVRQ